MCEAGYCEAEVARAGTMLRKEGIKRDAEVQALEDVICFTFLRWYFEPFAPTQDAGRLERIVAKTARKMSPGARARAPSSPCPRGSPAISATEPGGQGSSRATYPGRAKAALCTSGV